MTSIFNFFGFFRNKVFLLTLILFAIIGLFVFKSFFIYFTVLLAFLVGFLVYLSTNLNPQLKLFASTLSIVICFCFGLISGFSSNGEVYSSKTVNANFASSSKSSASSRNVNDAFKINNNYNIDTVSPKNENLEATISNHKQILKNNISTTKNFKLFNVEEVYSPTTISVSELGLVQLLGINSPAFNFQTNCLEGDAKQKLEDILIGRNVYLEFDNSGMYDGSGRLLAYVYLQSDYFVNLQMIKDGLVYNVEKQISDHYRFDQFESTELEAKLIPSGVWVDNVCEKQQNSATNSSVFSAPTGATSSSRRSVNNFTISVSSSSSISQTSSASSEKTSSSSKSSTSSLNSSAISSNNSSTSGSVAISSSKASSAVQFSRNFGNFNNALPDGQKYYCTTNPNYYTTTDAFTTWANCLSWADTENNKN